MSAASDAQLTREILARLRADNFALVGICDARAIERQSYFQQWLADGHHGEMQYLAQHFSQRMDPTVLVPEARSVICVADRYSDGRADHRVIDGLPRGRIARYARGRDYHRVLRDRLEPLANELRRRFPGERFRVCVDTAPIAEREHALRAGLGRIGKHTLLIGEQGMGSWLLLGEIVTTMHLQPSEANTSDPCGSCTRCIDACPTQAIEPWKLNAERCISYLTIEHQGAAAAWFHQRTDDWLFGCDACIEACPHSQFTHKSRGAAPSSAYASTHASFALEEVLAWNPEDPAYQGLSTILRRSEISTWKRNALLLLQSLPASRVTQSLRESIQACATDTYLSQSTRDIAGAWLRADSQSREGWWCRSRIRSRFCHWIGWR